MDPAYIATRAGHMEDCRAINKNDLYYLKFGVSAKIVNALCLVSSPEAPDASIVTIFASTTESQYLGVTGDITSIDITAPGSTARLDIPNVTNVLPFPVYNYTVERILFPPNFPLRKYGLDGAPDELALLARTLGLKPAPAHRPPAPTPPAILSAFESRKAWDEALGAQLDSFLRHDATVLDEDSIDATVLDEASIDDLLANPELIAPRADALVDAAIAAMQGRQEGRWPIVRRLVVALPDAAFTRVGPRLLSSLNSALPEALRTPSFKLENPPFLERLGDLGRSAIPILVAAYENEPPLADQAIVGLCRAGEEAADAVERIILSLGEAPGLPNVSRRRLLLLTAAAFRSGRADLGARIGGLVRGARIHGVTQRANRLDDWARVYAKLAATAGPTSDKSVCFIGRVRERLNIAPLAPPPAPP